jgi:hypothetical protein
VYDRALQAASTPIIPHSLIPDPKPTDTPQLSEQAVLTLALIDCLCFLPVNILEEWLPLAAQLINRIRDHNMKEVCQDRLWVALSSGEMDVERANFCVTWWTTRGGREMVLFGTEDNKQVPCMSGALGAAMLENKL